MEILKLSPYCYPEKISSSHLTDDLNMAFEQAGFHTSIYSPLPCRGLDKITRKKYKKIKHETLNNGSIDIHRFSMFNEGSNVFLRATRYILVNLIQYFKGIKATKTDLIYAASTPPTQAVLCSLVKKKLIKKTGRYIPFVYHLQDVFPDSLVSCGLTKKDSLIWKIGRKIEDFSYRNADKIIVISNDIKINIINKGVDEDKITVIPNWIDTKHVHYISRGDNPLFDELQIDKSKFIISYAGNIGTAQGIDTILGTAKQFENEQQVQFVIFGGGSKFDYYKEIIKNVSNVKLFPLQAPDKISEVYSIGDVSLVACKKGVGFGAFPSKTFSIMATATPVLLSFDKGTELWRVIESNRCGICVEADDIDGLVNAIQFARRNREQLKEMGKNSKNCIESCYSKEICTSKIVKELLKSLHNERIE